MACAGPAEVGHSAEVQGWAGARRRHRSVTDTYGDAMTVGLDDMFKACLRASTEGVGAVPSTAPS